MTDTMTAGETTTISPARVLERVLDDVLTDASRWTRGAAGRDLAGNTTSGDNCDAVQFCIMGAIQRVIVGCGWNRHQEPFWDLLQATTADVNRAIGGDDFVGTRIATFNDAPSTTFEDVRLVLKRAAAE